MQGADTLEKVQERTKVGIYDESVIPKVKELIEKYKRKYRVNG